MRQRDPSEREVLEALRDGDPEPYLAMARESGTLTVHEREDEALDSGSPIGTARERQSGSGTP